MTFGVGWLTYDILPPTPPRYVNFLQLFYLFWFCFFSCTFFLAIIFVCVSLVSEQALISYYLYDMWLLSLSVMQYQFQMPVLIEIKFWICSLAMNTSFWYIRMYDTWAGVMQIRLSSCPCIILFSFRAKLLQLLTKTHLTPDPYNWKRQGSCVYKASYKWIHKWNQ